MNKPMDFFNSYQEAVLVQDTSKMLSLYHKDILIFDMWNVYQKNGINVLETQVNDWFSSIKNEKVIVTFNEINLIEDEKIAFANAIISFEAFDKENNKIRQMKNRITINIIKLNNNWLVKHQHTSVPINSENIKGILE